MAAPEQAKGMLANDCAAKDHVVYKVVLTGGPCAGKTTTLARLRTFFENLGWKVYTVPETATVLLGGGVKFSELDKTQQFEFNENIVRTMYHIEQTFFSLAVRNSTNTLVVCDRGMMDPSAFCTKHQWQEVMKRNGWNEVILRDTRYDHVIHMVTAAKGADAFYQTENNGTRSEGLELACERDSKAAEAWVGHPYCDSIDNSTDFEQKVRRVIEAVCRRLGNRLDVDVDDRLRAESKKRKFLVKELPPDDQFPWFKDIAVQHDYLLSSQHGIQTRIRKRGQRGQYSYTYTERKKINEKSMELLRQITRREYELLLKQRDPTHHAVHKIRRCFLWEGHYYQLDIFQKPETPRCKNLILMETYTSQQGSDLKLPGFVVIETEVTGNPVYSMFNLSAAS